RSPRSPRRRPRHRCRVACSSATPSSVPSRPNPPPESPSEAENPRAEDPDPRRLWPRRRGTPDPRYEPRTTGPAARPAGRRRDGGDDGEDAPVHEARPPARGAAALRRHLGHREPHHDGWSADAARARRDDLLVADGRPLAAGPRQGLDDGPADRELPADRLRQLQDELRDD